MGEKPRTSLRRLSVGALAAGLGLWVGLPAAANAAAGAALGQQLIQQKCAACHTVGGGTLVGPDLKGVTTRRSREWLEQWITNPGAVLAKHDPYATALLQKFHGIQMPDLGLSSTDISAVIDYLGTTASGSGAAAAAPAAAPAVQGDPQMGKALFTGEVAFAAGGPPCMACHSVGGIGALGGGHLGPDLTEIVSTFGGTAGVNAFLTGTPTPTMNAVWSKNPLSPTERADVVSFLGQAAVTQRPAQAVWQLGVLALIGLAVLLTIGARRWNYRLRFGVRGPMVAKPTTGHTDAHNGGWFAGPWHDGWKARYPNPNANDESRGPASARRS